MTTRHRSVPVTPATPCCGCGEALAVSVPYGISVQGGTRGLRLARKGAAYHRPCAEARIAELRAAEVARHGVSR